mgnify:CR=1 FL=1
MLRVRLLCPISGSVYERKVRLFFLKEADVSTPVTVSAAVVIPFHRPQLKDLEVVALARCRKVLGSHPRYLAIPMGMDTAALRAIDPDLVVLGFDPAWFRSAVGYNLLCRSTCFYRPFAGHDFLLLYQLDAYVFSDQLSAWCGRGFDYIGAPWLHHEFQAHSRKTWTKSPLIRPFLRRVGNGGFSLRRVRTLRRASFWLWPLSWLLRSIPEDVFWAHVGARLWPGFRIAGVEEAVRFAWDAAPEECHDLCAGKKPFGCHAWNTEHVGFWKDKIDEPVAQS